MILIILIAIVLFIPTALIGFLFWWWMWKKGPYGRVAATIVTGLIAYEFITAIFPPESFYSYEYSYITGIAFPPSANIIFKKASYPDFHGDFACDILFEVSAEDYAWLARAARLNPATGDECLGGKYYTEITDKLGHKLDVNVFGSIRKRDTDVMGAWALLKDGKTVYFWFAQY